MADALRLAQNTCARAARTAESARLIFRADPSTSTAIAYAHAADLEASERQHYEDLALQALADDQSSAS